MWLYKHYNQGINIALLSLFFVSGTLSSQVILPQIGDTLFSYSNNLDQALSNPDQYDFYDFDFHCMDRLAVIDADAPRLDFEILNQHGTGEAYAVKDDVLYVKGFRMVDPYLGKSIKFTQLIGGIPLVNLDDITNYKHEGTQNIYLEYAIAELPEFMNLWAESFGYKKMRIKVNLDYKTTYLGMKALDLFDNKNYHQVQTSYIFKVVEVQMQSDEWVVVSLDDVPDRAQYLQDKLVSYSSYYNGVTLFPNIREYNHPEIKLEFRMPYATQRLPICSASSAQVYVYPNPTLGDLNIRIFDLEPGVYDFAVYNIIGFKVWETELTYGEKELFRLRLPHLDKGIYLYSIKNKQGRYIQSKRLTVLEY